MIGLDNRYRRLTLGCMPDRSSRPKRPRDPNVRAKLIVDIATGDVEDQQPDKGKNPAAVALGWLGGKKGGNARAETIRRRTGKLRHYPLFLVSCTCSWLGYIVVVILARMQTLESEAATMERACHD